MANYTEITTNEEWQGVLKQSMEKPILLFKHSTTCPISAAAHDEFTKFSTDVDAYLVKVIESRPVSNEIAKDLDTQHQSPQAFVVSNGKAAWNASHWNITEKSLAEALAESSN